MKIFGDFFNYLFYKCQHFIDTYWGLSLSLSLSHCSLLCIVLAFSAFCNFKVWTCQIWFKSFLDVLLKNKIGAVGFFSFQITLSEGTFSLFLFPNLAQHLVLIPSPFYCVTLFGIVSNFLNFFPFLFFFFLPSPPKVKKRKRKEEEEAEFTLFYRDLDPWIFVVFKWAFGIVSGFDVLGKFCHWSNKVNAEINFCFLF